MKSGIFARRVVFPLHERLMKRPTMPYLAELERAQYLPRHEIERLNPRMEWAEIDAPHLVLQVAPTLAAGVIDEFISGAWAE